MSVFFPVLTEMFHFSAFPITKVLPLFVLDITLAGFLHSEIVDSTDARSSSTLIVSVLRPSSAFTL